MKKSGVILLICILCMAMFGCSSTSTTKSYSDTFNIDGIFYSQASTFNPYDNGITDEEYFNINPQNLEEQQTDNDEITLFVFASLGSLPDGEGDLTLPESTYSEFLPGYTLPLNLSVGGVSYSNNYEANDYKDKLSKNWYEYESGEYLDTDYVLYEGTDDEIKIVGMFFVKYHDYKEAKANGEEITLSWGSYQTATQAENVVKVGSIASIPSYLS